MGVGQVQVRHPHLLQLQQVEPEYLDGLDHQVVQLRVGREQRPLGADLLSKGSNILIEGVRGADVTTWG